MINCIYKPNGSRIWRWKFRAVPADGKVSDVSLGTSEKQAAEKKRMELLREKQHERAGLIPSKAFRDAAQRNLAGHLAEFIGDLKSKGLNAKYVGDFENRLKLLMDKCPWQLPQDMTADSFVAWRSSSKDRSPKTLNEYLTCAKGFANWLLAQGRIAVNPLALIKKVETRGREVRPRRAYDDAELSALLSVAGAQRNVYLMAALTGIRHGELRKLRWGDINLSDEKASVTVRASVSKNHKLACLPLHPDLVAALRAFRPSDAGAADLVFKGLVPRSEVLNSQLTAAKIVKVDTQGRVVDFHSLRHTFCTNLQRANVSQREAMELMRHSDPRLTAKTYTDSTMLPLRSAVEKLVCPASPASQGASQILGATSHLSSRSVTGSNGDKTVKPIANKGGKSRVGMGWRVLSQIEEWCAVQVSNLRPLPCEGNALPLS